MQIYVYRPAGNLGPYSSFDLRSMVQAGLIRPDELGWQEGMAEWKPLSTFVPLATLPPVPVPAPPPAATVRGAALEPFLGTRTPNTASFDEGMRREYLSAEANVRSIGILYYLGCLGCTFLGAGQLLEMAQPHQHPSAVDRILPFVLLALGVGYFWLGRQIRALNPRVIIPASILACIGLLGFPIGTIINALILYAIHGPKGQVVFSSEYQGVRERTPHIVYRTSAVVWVLLALILLVIGVAIYGSMTGH